MPGCGKRAVIGALSAPGRLDPHKASPFSGESFGLYQGAENAPRSARDPHPAAVIRTEVGNFSGAYPEFSIGKKRRKKEEKKLGAIYPVFTPLLPLFHPQIIPFHPVDSAITLVLTCFQHVFNV
jgi:hypothetical protein